MTHKQLRRQLLSLMRASGRDWTGFARILETMGDIAEHSQDKLIRRAASGIQRTLTGVEEGGQFIAVDFHDKRTARQLDAAYLK